MIKIGDLSIKTAKPAELDATLIASTGFGLSEVNRLIAGTQDLAARALMPFVAPDDEAPSQSAIAVAIGTDPKARDQIRALYASHSSTIASIEQSVPE